MESKQNLPEEYEPFARLIFCGNVLENVLIPFEVNDHIPLLIGKGEIPQVWLEAPSDPGDGEWASLIRQNIPAGESKLLRLRESSADRSVSVTFGALRILHAVRGPSESEAMVDRLDLRPFGLNIYGDASGLSVGGKRFAQNSFANLRTMIAIGPTKA